MLRTTSFSASGQEQGIHQYIPPDLRRMFYKNPARVHASQNGLDPYGFMTRGLVLYLPLWALKDSAFKSIDAYKHTSTVTNATWGITGRTFVTATGGKIVIPDANVLDQTDAITLMGWTKLDTADQANSLMGKATTIWTEVSYTVELSSVNNVMFKTSSDGGVPDALNSNFGVVVDTWYFIACTFSRPARIIYVNGAAQNNDAWDNDINVGTSDIYIGKYAGDSATTAGTIGEAWIYNRALSAGEVLHNYNVTKWRYQ